jgi:hypothetical protein
VSSPAARWSTGWQTSDGEGDWTHHGVFGGGSSDGGVADERRRRNRGNTVAAARSPARERTQLSNVLHTGLLGTLGKVLDGLVGSGVARRAELADGCPAAAAGTLAPVSRRLGQANKRVQELQGVLVE